MKGKRIALGVMVILCFFTVYQAGAVDITTGSKTGGARGGGPGHGPGFSETLTHLEEQGYDVSAIQAAIESNDMDTARTLMDRFMDEHPDALPGRDHVPPGDGETDASHITRHLDQLEQQGYDVSAIRAAVENGDMETAHTLMDQFMGEHRDALPVPAGSPDCKGPDDTHRITGLLERLTDDGYDVTTIQAAVESGDMDTARTLLHQFIEEHRDELPGPGRLAGKTA